MKTCARLTYRMRMRIAAIESIMAKRAHCINLMILRQRVSIVWSWSINRTASLNISSLSSVDCVAQLPEVGAGHKVSVVVFVLCFVSEYGFVKGDRMIERQESFVIKRDITSFLYTLQRYCEVFWAFAICYSKTCMLPVCQAAGETTT